MIALGWFTFLAVSLFLFFVKKRQEEKLTPKKILHELFHGTLVGLTLAFFNSFTLPTEEKIVSTVEIVSLAKKDVSKGSMLLFIGDVKTTPYYEYFEKSAEGYKFYRINVERNTVLISETKDEKSVLKTSETFIKKEYRNFTLFSTIGDPKYHFYVPEGTIKKEIHIL